MTQSVVISLYNRYISVPYHALGSRILALLDSYHYYMFPVTLITMIWKVQQ